MFRHHCLHHVFRHLQYMSSPTTPIIPPPPLPLKALPQSPYALVAEEDDNIVVECNDYKLKNYLEVAKLRSVLFIQ